MSDICDIKVGMRVKLIHMDDEQPVPDGTEGVVTGVDDIGNIHVKWDTDSTLSLIPGIDDFEFIP